MELERLVARLEALAAEPAAQPAISHLLDFATSIRVELPTIRHRCAGTESVLLRCAVDWLRGSDTPTGVNLGVFGKRDYFAKVPGTVEGLLTSFKSALAAGHDLAGARQAALEYVAESGDEPKMFSQLPANTALRQDDFETFAQCAAAVWRAERDAAAAQLLDHWVALVAARVESFAGKPDVIIALSDFAPERAGVTSLHAGENAPGPRSSAPTGGSRMLARTGTTSCPPAWCATTTRSCSRTWRSPT